jgi:HSP20 family protein
MDVISADMERFFYRLFHSKCPLKTLAEPGWQPLTDICETDDAFIVKMELAGVRREDVKIELNGDRLSISGLRPEQLACGVKVRHQIEINYGHFRRVFLLKGALSREAIAARFQNGFLYIRMPKAVQPKRVTKIQIVHEKE